MRLRHGENAWVFKNENLNEEETHSVDASSAASSFRPKTEFKKFMVRQMHSLSTLYQSQFDKIDKDITIIQEKLGIQSLNDDDDEEEENDEDEKVAMEEDGEGDDGDDNEE
ncbi:hypothetical protein LR48_Vigan07g187500 [Vigna angularis]|uniref:Uncharacterized protein n=1 Tax=Phaseolus angularis TaxID=3914 RepID=A0A0L9UZP1_PHAAN|nr:hypothetical protein LR48_Vigan07g187500 [Vigna angularis]